MAASSSTTNTDHEAAALAARDARIVRAFFRGGGLTPENPAYLEAAFRIIETLLREDLAAGDLTASALGIGGERVSAHILAREDGVIAGVAEIAALYRKHEVAVEIEQQDGESIGAGDVVMRVEGSQAALLGLERTALNILQRMSGIATAARRLQDRVHRTASRTRIVGTRKTHWGLLDKRALHLGGAGTHRLGLGDAILIKNNHLALIANSEEEAAPKVIERAWAARGKSAFIEVEVRSEAAARAAAQAFQRLQRTSAEDYPCVLMLDNMAPREMSGVIASLRQEGLWDSILVEASGGICESNVEEYAACGADVISIGALTHSVQALDLSQRMNNAARMPAGAS